MNNLNTLQETNSLHALIKNILGDRRLYGNLASGGSRLLRTELATRSIDIFDISWRSKSLPSVLEKIIRKPDSSLNSITDRAGIRVICPYSNNIHRVLDTVKEVFKIEHIEDTTKRGGLSAFGYSSFHCLVKWNPDYSGPILIEDLPPYLNRFLDGKPITGKHKENLEQRIHSANDDAHNLLLEIQVRTILQHAWASISHQTLYKYEEIMAESTIRRLARLAGILEEVDEAFSEEVGRSTKMPQRNLLAIETKRIPLTDKYLQDYSIEVLGLELDDKQARWALDYAELIGLKNVFDFEEIMNSTIEALESAFSSPLLQALRGLWMYLSLLAVWAKGIETTICKSPTTLNEANRYRGLVHEELFQSVLQRLQST